MPSRSKSQTRSIFALATRSKAAGSKKRKASASSPLTTDALPDGLKEFEVGDSTEENLEALLFDGVLPSQSLIEWRTPSADDLPVIGADQQIVFRCMFQHGFGLPCCSFFRGLLCYYGLELVNLNLNSILHIDIFIHLCEAFLGVEQLMAKIDVNPHYPLVAQDTVPDADFELLEDNDFEDSKTQQVKTNLK